MRDFLTRDFRTEIVTDEESEYVMSDGQPDRTNDIIDPAGWIISEHETTALFNHDKHLIVGVWKNVRVVGKKLIGKLRLAAAGTSPVVDYVRKLIEQGMLEGVSVGFKPHDSEPLDPKNPFWGAQKYTKAELLECSLVAVAANPRARRIAKSFFPDSEIDRLFVPSGENGGRRSLPVRGKSAETNSPHHGSRPMKLSERIAARKDQVTVIMDKLAGIKKRVEETDDDISDDVAAEQEALSGELAEAQKQLARLELLEKDVALRADNGGGGGDRHDDDSRRQIDIIPPNRDDNPIRSRARMARGYDGFVRAAVVNFLAYKRRQSIDQVLHAEYGKHRQFREIEAIIKATSAPAMTNVVGWAAELVGANVEALMETIKPVSIYPRIAAGGVSFSFEGRVPIIIPSRAYGTVPGPGTVENQRNRRLSGAFVGEGQPIPVRQGLLQSITLNPYKMSVISTFTKEMENATAGQIEQIIREAIAEDTAWALDMALLSDEAAIPGVRPPGIFNGVAGIPPTAGGGSAAAIADLKALIGAVMASGGGRNIQLIMNPLQGLSLSLMIDSGVFLFRDEVARGQLLTFSLIQSITVPVGEVYAIDAADFASATGDPMIDVSDQATLHMNDGGYPAPFTAPDVKPIVGAAAAPPAVADIATPVRSLWQTATIGVRMLMWTSWAMRRAGMVAHIEGVTW